MLYHCFASLLEVVVAAAVVANNREDAAAGNAAAHDHGVAAETAAAHTPLTVERVMREQTVVDKFQ